MSNSSVYIQQRVAINGDIGETFKLPHMGHEYHVMRRDYMECTKKPHYKFYEIILTLPDSQFPNTKHFAVWGKIGSIEPQCEERELKWYETMLRNKPKKDYLLKYTFHNIGKPKTTKPKKIVSDEESKLRNDVLERLDKVIKAAEEYDHPELHYVRNLWVKLKQDCKFPTKEDYIKCNYIFIQVTTGALVK